MILLFISKIICCVFFYKYYLFLNKLRFYEKRKWKEEIILLGEKYYNRNLNIVINIIFHSFHIAFLRVNVNEFFFIYALQNYNYMFIYYYLRCEMFFTFK